MISLLLLLLLGFDSPFAQLEQENELLRIELNREMRVEMNLKRELSNMMFILELNEKWSEK